MSVSILEYDGPECRLEMARARLDGGGKWWCIRGIAQHPSGISEVRIGDVAAVLKPDSGGGVRFTGFVAAREGEQQVSLVARATNGQYADELYRVTSVARDPARPEQRTFVLTGLRRQLLGESGGREGARPAAPLVGAAGLQAAGAAPPSAGAAVPDSARAAALTDGGQPGRPAGLEDAAGQYIRILEPAEWSGLTSRGIELPSRRALRVVGYASHPNGVASVEIDGRAAAVARDGRGGHRFTGFVPVGPGAREVLILVHGVSGLPVVGRYTLRGTPAERTFTTREEAWSPATGFRGKRWALVVGVAAYADTAISPLRFADDDARAFYQFLRSPRAGLDGFPEANVKLLLNEQATYAELRSALFSFLRQASEEDEVVIYFAGHGAPDPLRPNDLYLLTYDTRATELSATGFPMQDLNRAVEEMYARHIVLITDACHSGGITAPLAARGGRNPVHDAFLNHLSATKGGLAVFTASQSDQSSFEDQRWGGGHGVFTHFLLEGLNGAADEDGDRIVTLVEMMHWTTAQVRRETLNSQIPSIGDRAYDPFLPLSMVLTAEERTAPEPPEPDSARSAVGGEPAKLPAALADSLARAREAVRLFPTSPAYHHNLGLLLLRAESFDEAITALLDAVRLDPEAAAFHLSLSKAYRHAGKLDAAIGALETALYHDRQNAAYLHELGTMLLEAGRSEEAIASLRRAVRIEATSGTYHAALGRAFWQAGRLREAAASLRTAVQQDPATAAHHRDLAMVLAGDHQLDAALPEMKEAVRRAPSRADYLADLSSVLQSAGLPEDARRAMVAAVQLDSSSAEYHNTLGILLRDAGLQYEALVEFRAAARLDPGNSAYRYNHGELLGGSNQVDSAIAELREAVRLDAENAQFHNGLGRVLRKAGLPAEALEALLRATRLDPAQARYHFDLGTMYMEAGRWAEAVPTLQRAVELEPGNRDYSATLRSAQRKMPRP